MGGTLASKATYYSFQIHAGSSSGVRLRAAAEISLLRGEPFAAFRLVKLPPLTSAPRAQTCRGSSTRCSCPIPNILPNVCLWQSEPFLDSSDPKLSPSVTFSAEFKAVSDVTQVQTWVRPTGGGRSLVWCCFWYQMLSFNAGFSASYGVRKTSHQPYMRRNAF